MTLVSDTEALPVLRAVFSPNYIDWCRREAEEATHGGQFGHARACIREAERAEAALTKGLRYVRADGSFDRPAMDAAIGRQVATSLRNLDRIPSDIRAEMSAWSVDQWRRVATSNVEAEARGELQIWECRSGVNLVSQEAARLAVGGTR